MIEAPAIGISPLPVELPDLSSFDLLCLTSPNAVARLFELIRDARDLAGLRIAVIGPGTAAALRERGIEPDIVPERFVGEGLLEALEGVDVQRALIARARDARDVLPDGLRARGVEVEVLTTYEAVAEPLRDEVREAALEADYVTFASGSAGRYFFEAVDGARPKGRVVSIGPTTSDVLRGLGVEPDVEATTHTPDGLTAELVKDASQR